MIFLTLGLISVTIGLALLTIRVRRLDKDLRFIYKFSVDELDKIKARLLNIEVEIGFVDPKGAFIASGNIEDSLFRPRGYYESGSQPQVIPAKVKNTKITVKKKPVSHAKPVEDIKPKKPLGRPRKEKTEKNPRTNVRSYRKKK